MYFLHLWPNEWGMVNSKFCNWADKIIKIAKNLPKYHKKEEMTKNKFLTPYHFPNVKVI